MSTRDERAAERRTGWESEVVRAGEPKGPLYSELTHAERLLALARLNERVWLAAGHSLPAPGPRSEWPGEIYRL